jgi:hypothetical protein
MNHELFFVFWERSAMTHEIKQSLSQIPNPNPNPNPKSHSQSISISILIFYLFFQAEIRTQLNDFLIQRHDSIPAYIRNKVELVK